MSEKKKEVMIDWREKYPTHQDQLEFFLLKFSKEQDITRPKVQDLLDAFMKFLKPGTTELEEHEILRLLESNYATKTFKELRVMIADIDKDQNKKLSFLEWACAFFEKSWEKLLSPSSDPEQIAAAEKLFNEAAEKEAKKQAEAQDAEDASNKKKLDELKAAESKAAAEGNVQAAADAKRASEAEAKRQAEALKKKHADEALRKAQLEREAAEKREQDLKKAGVAGRVALFKYAANDKKDTTKDNKAQIDEQVAKKKAIKQQEIEALAKRKLAEEKEETAKAAAVIADREAKEAARLAALALAVKERADVDAKAAAEEKTKADEETKKAREGKEATLKEIALYESKKKVDEEEKKKIADELEKKRAEGRAKLANKSSLWNSSSSSSVVSSIPTGAKLNNAKTEEKTGMQQIQLLGSIKKGTNLTRTPGVKVASEELTDDQRADFVAERMKGNSVSEQ